ncbi:MAG: T9SS type A sorting domain-containing protein [Bacteroidales bacterium]|nr:T9SS type A sorting domain-containing protein [Bacteroidales bacterium]
MQNKTQTNLNVSAYEPGIYMLRIDTKKGRFVRKIVITE